MHLIISLIKLAYILSLVKCSTFEEKLNNDLYKLNNESQQFKQNLDLKLKEEKKINLLSRSGKQLDLDALLDGRFSNHVIGERQSRQLNENKFNYNLNSSFSFQSLNQILNESLNESLNEKLNKSSKNIHNEESILKHASFVPHFLENTFNLMYPPNTSARVINQPPEPSELYLPQQPQPQPQTPNVLNSIFLPSTEDRILINILTQANSGLPIYSNQFNNPNIGQTNSFTNSQTNSNLQSFSNILTNKKPFSSITSSIQEIAAYVLPSKLGNKFRRKHSSQVTNLIDYNNYAQECICVPFYMCKAGYIEQNSAKGSSQNLPVNQFNKNYNLPFSFEPDTSFSNKDELDKYYIPIQSSSLISSSILNKKKGQNKHQPPPEEQNFNQQNYNQQNYNQQNFNQQNINQQNINQQNINQQNINQQNSHQNSNLQNFNQQNINKLLNQNLNQQITLNNLNQENQEQFIKRYNDIKIKNSIFKSTPQPITINKRMRLDSSSSNNLPIKTNTTYKLTDISSTQSNNKQKLEFNSTNSSTQTNLNELELPIDERSIDGTANYNATSFSQSSDNDIENLTRMLGFSSNSQTSNLPFTNYKEDDPKNCGILRTCCPLLSRKDIYLAQQSHAIIRAQAELNKNVVNNQDNKHIFAFENFQTNYDPILNKNTNNDFIFSSKFKNDLPNFPLNNFIPPNNNFNLNQPNKQFTSSALYKNPYYSNSFLNLNQARNDDKIFLQEKIIQPSSPNLVPNKQFLNNQFVEARNQNNNFENPLINLKSTKNINSKTSVNIKNIQCGRKFSDKIGARTINTNQSINASEFGEYPWQAILLRKLGNGESLFVCGGTLLSDQWVLTAAHCVKNNSFDELKIRLGEWDINREDEYYSYVERNIVDIIKHPNYYPNTLANDLALLRLDQIINFELTPHISPVCRANFGNNFIGKKCWVAGWGKDAFGQKGNYQNVLKKVELPILDHNQCSNIMQKTRLGNNFDLHPGFMCAGGEPDKDACEGDGGSALVCEVNQVWKAAGLVSWGIGCGKPGIPGVYVNLGYYEKWINNILENSRENYLDNKDFNENNLLTGNGDLLSDSSQTIKTSNLIDKNNHLIDLKTIINERTLPNNNTQEMSIN